MSANRKEIWKMKAVHSEEFFRQYQEELFEKYKRDCDFEGDLKMLLIDFPELPEEYREQARKVYTKMQASKVYETGKANLMNKQRMIKEIRSGKASLGYTTWSQEATAWHDLVEGFEFCCLMLADFKKKHIDEVA